MHTVTAHHKNVTRVAQCRKREETDLNIGYLAAFGSRAARAQERTPRPPPSHFRYPIQRSDIISSRSTKKHVSRPFALCQSWRTRPPASLLHFLALRRTLSRRRTKSHRPLCFRLHTGTEAVRVLQAAMDGTWMDLVSLEGVRCAHAGDIFACNLQTIRWCVVQLLATTFIPLT